MEGAIIKSYYAEKNSINPKDITVVSIMPCSAKKEEKKAEPKKEEKVQKSAPKKDEKKSDKPQKKDDKKPEAKEKKDDVLDKFISDLKNSGINVTEE